MEKKIELYVGLKFKSIHYDGVTEIMTINKERNTLDVKISRSENDYHYEDDWNLKVTEWAFERGEYEIINERPDTGKNGQIEMEGAYAE